MNELNLDAIEKLAKGATQGPFSVERREEDCGYFRYIVHGARGDVAWCNDELDTNARRHANFLTEVTPQVVLQLIAAARELEELRGAILFMNERGHWQNTTPTGIVQRAKDFGWDPKGTK